MKKYLIPALTSLLLTGCATGGMGLQKAYQTAKSQGGGLKEYLILSKAYPQIASDNEKETLLRIYNYGRSVYSGGEYMGDGQGLLSTIEDLEKYCTTDGGQFTFGKYAYPILKKRYVPMSFTYINYLTKAKNAQGDYFARCNSNDGFTIDYYVGKFDLWTTYHGEVQYWSSFLKITHDKPQKTGYARKDAQTIDRKRYMMSYIQEQKGKLYYTGKGGDVMYIAYQQCLKDGGKPYYASFFTDYKKTPFQKYLFDMTHYKFKKEGLNPKDKIFAVFMPVVSKRADFWCEGGTFQFGFSTYDGTWFHYHTDPVPKATQGMAKKIDTASQKSLDIDKLLDVSVQKATPKSKSESIAMKVFQTKSFYETGNPHEIINGYYIGKKNNCEIVAVQKKNSTYSEMRTFYKCDGNIIDKGASIDNLESDEYSYIRRFLPNIYRNCLINGKAYSNYGDMEIMCKSNQNAAQIAILKRGKVVNVSIKKIR